MSHPSRRRFIIGSSLAAVAASPLGRRVLAAQTETPMQSPNFLDWARTPPMGWNSWDCFGTAVTEDLTKQNADYMAEHLLAHGWRLITVDIQWYEPNSSGHHYRNDATLRMDSFGRLLPAENKFPSAAGDAGFKPLADYVHGKGLTFGIHLMRGIPRQAVKENTRVLGTPFTARDIANTNDTCPWNPDMFGVDMSKPGAQAYYDSVFALIASWNVDFVKVDDLSRPYHDHEPEIEAIRRAIDKTGRPMVLSTSPGETPLSAAEHVKRHANMWRTSDDFWDNWRLLNDQFTRARNWAPHAGPGHWPDHDMLALGNIRVGQNNPWTQFTRDEQLTHMTLWAIARSPLIFGGHLPGNDDFTLSLLTNDEVIAVNQRGHDARELQNDNGLITWTSLADERSTNVAIFNTRDTGPHDVRVDFSTLGMGRHGFVRDLWQQADLGRFEAGYTRSLAPHACAMLRITSAD